MKVRNTLLIFLLSGFWHGANWTFIFWGLLNALYFIPLLLGGRNRVNMEIVDEGKLIPSMKSVGQIGSTFLLVSVAWVFFRSENIEMAFSYLAIVFSPSLFQAPTVFPFLVIIGVALFVLIEWIQRDREHALHFSRLNVLSRNVVWGFAYILVGLMFLFGGKSNSFIYFQF